MQCSDDAPRQTVAAQSITDLLSGLAGARLREAKALQKNAELPDVEGLFERER